MSSNKRRCQDQPNRNEQPVDQADADGRGEREPDHGRQRQAGVGRVQADDPGHDHDRDGGEVDPAADDDDRRERRRNPDDGDGLRDVEDVLVVEEVLRAEAQVDAEEQEDQGQAHLGPQEPRPPADGPARDVAVAGRRGARRQRAEFRMRRAGDRRSAATCSTARCWPW